MLAGSCPAGGARIALTMRTSRRSLAPGAVNARAENLAPSASIITLNHSWIYCGNDEYVQVVTP
jgi:hypothetical protein